MTDVEETLVLVKPDGVARNLTGEILRRIEEPLPCRPWSEVPECCGDPRTAGLAPPGGRAARRRPDDRSGGRLAAVARRARERCLDEHTAKRRAREMVAALEGAAAPAAGD